MTASVASTPEPSSVVSKGLKAGALGLVATIVIGVASTAPGYSLAASVGYVTDEVGLQAPAIMLVAFIPMAFIAAAYFYMNRADPDCGTTFTWATRAFGPRTGWLGGWGIIMADLVIMPNLAGVTAQYSFLLFGLDSWADNRWATALLGCLFILAMTWICVTGIELSARSQVLLLGTEILVLVGFSVMAIAEVYGSDPPAGSVKPSLSWINPFAINDWGALTGGVLVALFIYWGWDTAVTVNEECEDANTTPGKAAIWSTVILLLVYVVVTIGAQAAKGPGFLTDHPDDALGAVGDVVLGSTVNKLLILAVLSSAMASTQTTILPAARSMLSMGSHKAGPERLASVDRRHLTPAWSTWFFGIASCVWFVFLVAIGGEAQNPYYASIAAVGLMIAFYYGLTGIVCVFYYRRYLLKSWRNLLFVGVMPGIGGLVLTYIFFRSLIDNFNDTESYGSLLGAGSVFTIGVALLLLGVPLMLLSKSKYPDFFRIQRDPLDVRPNPDGSGDPAPTLGTYRKEVSA
ncbi:MAG: APC family permease [Acidimicrobiales bacterium]